MNSRLREKGRRALDKKNEQEKSTEGEEFTGKVSTGVKNLPEKKVLE